MKVISARQLPVEDKTQHIAGILYAGSALGAVFAGDLVTLVIFWELLAMTSVFLVWARRRGRALAPDRGSDLGPRRRSQKVAYRFRADGPLDGGHAAFPDARRDTARRPRSR